MVILENRFGRVEVQPQGAQVVSYVPVGGRDLLWVSPRARWDEGEPLRGGIPLCVPWFAHRYPGKAIHGFVRTQPWASGAVEALENGRSRVTFTLEDTAGTRSQWPTSFRFEHEVTLGPELGLVFRAQNLGHQPVDFEAVWHTYFAVASLGDVSIRGLEGCPYFDKNDGRRSHTAQTVVLRGPTDWLFPRVPEVQWLEDSDRQLRIWSDAPGAVVWNAGSLDRTVPDLGEGAHRGYVCLERGFLDQGQVPLVPGRPFEVAMTISAAPVDSGLGGE